MEATERVTTRFMKVLSEAIDPFKKDQNLPLIEPLYIKSVELLECDLTEIFYKDDPRTKDPRMLKAIAEETRDLLIRARSRAD